MNNRDFFRLMIKLFGIYQFFIIVFSVLPGNISFVFNKNLFPSSAVMIPVIFIALFILGIFFLLIKFPDKIIDLFKLDKGFDQKKIMINNFNSETVLQIGLVFIGGFLIVQNISNFISLLITYFRLSHTNLEIFNAAKNMNDLLFSGINVIIGFLLITFRKKISEKFQ